MSAIGAEKQSTAVMQPGEGALDDPAVASQPRAVCGLPSCDHRLDAALPDEAAVPVVVVAAVGDDAVGPSPRPAEQDGGLEGALAKLAHASNGPFLLGLVAAGLIAFGVYSLSDARFRRI
jgi:hypothetical protein